MKITWIAAISVLALGLFAAAPIAYARQAPSDVGSDPTVDTEGIPDNDPDETGVADFQPELADIDGGQWADQQDFGPVWVPPVDSDSGWRPYTNGQWANTEQGFAWISNEPWGWATYHYGRWFYDGSLGWVWVPGTVWAPAWVAWNQGGGYLGWAPLPPSVGFTLEASLNLRAFRLGPRFYTFVRERDILAPRLSAVIVSTQRNETIIKATSNVTRYAVVQGRVVNRSIDAQRIARVTGRPVPTVQIASQVARNQAGGRGAFYQPPAIRGARTAHAEFGAALPARVAARRRTFQQPSFGGQTASGFGRPGQNKAGASTRSTNAYGYRQGGNNRSPQTRQPSGGSQSRQPSGWSSSSRRSQPPSARPAPPPPRSSAPPPRASAPPPRASAPPPRASAPPPRASAPPAQSGGHKPPH